MTGLSRGWVPFWPCWKYYPSIQSWRTASAARPPSDGTALPRFPSSWRPTGPWRRPRWMRSYTLWYRRTRRTTSSVGPWPKKRPGGTGPLYARARRNEGQVGRSKRGRSSRRCRRGWSTRVSSLPRRDRASSRWDCRPIGTSRTTRWTPCGTHPRRPFLTCWFLSWAWTSGRLTGCTLAPYWRRSFTRCSFRGIQSVCGRRSRQGWVLMGTPRSWTAVVVMPLARWSFERWTLRMPGTHAERTRGTRLRVDRFVWGGRRGGGTRRAPAAIRFGAPFLVLNRRVEGP